MALDPMLLRAHEVEARRRNTIIRLRACLEKDPRTAGLMDLLHFDLGMLNRAGDVVCFQMEILSYQLADKLKITDAMLTGLMPLVPEEEPEPVFAPWDGKAALDYDSLPQKERSYAPSTHYMQQMGRNLTQAEIDHFADLDAKFQKEQRREASKPEPRPAKLPSVNALFGRPAESEGPADEIQEGPPIKIR